MWKKEVLKVIIKYKFEIIEFIKDFIFKKEKEMGKVEIIETTHFKKTEVAVSSSYPNLALFPTDEKIIKNVNTSLAGMQKVRDTYVKLPCKITSFYRSAELNKAVGGAVNGEHPKGLAVDFTANTDLKKIYDTICRDRPKYIHKIFWYPKSNFLHISFVEEGKTETFICGVL